MSGIVAILKLDGSPADLGLFARMMDSLAHRGPDGSGHFVDGPVALQYFQYLRPHAETDWPVIQGP